MYKIEANVKPLIKLLCQMVVEHQVVRSHSTLIQRTRIEAYSGA